jgi:hypothetical protein
MKKQKTLSEILGFRVQSPYETKDIVTYERSLKKMNMLDLQSHAIELGLRPSDDRHLLEKTLVNTFKSKNTELLRLTNKTNLKVKSAPSICDVLNSKKVK